MDRTIRDVAQVPCALWRGIEALDESLAALPDWARLEARHAITMTGELCDAFADRRAGVAELCQWACHRLPGTMSIYAGRSGFIDPADIPAAAMDVASANWHATAQLVGRHLEQALLVDVGSTTSDIVPVRDGLPRARGYSDAERLCTGELVYAGVVRTPLMALTADVPFRGELIGVMAEYFATTADIYRLLGRLPEAADQQEAADGRGKSVAETETRLARMIGLDRVDASLEEWRGLAAAFAEAQLARVEKVSARILDLSGLSPDAPIVGCGVGRFVASDLAERLGRPFRELGRLVAPETGDMWISNCAPAVAVALLSASSGHG